MGNQSAMDASLIAPCGMNCAICRAYLRDKKKCPGCNTNDTHKPAYCFVCRIKNCEDLQDKNLNFCYECEKFPCYRVEQLDRRYRIGYTVSMIENLQHIKNSGMDNFIENENIKWSCKDCGGVICVHKGVCINCGAKRQL